MRVLRTRILLIALGLLGCTAEPKRRESVGAGSLAIAPPACDGSADEAPGTMLWSRAYGDAKNQRARQIEVMASGDILVSGYFDGALSLGGATLQNVGGEDAWVARLDPQGNHVWSRAFGASTAHPAYAHGIAVATDAAGDVAFTGTFTTTVDFGGGPLTSAGNDDFFLVKLDPAGAHLWSKRYGDAATQSAQAVRMDANGDVLVTGLAQGTIDFGGGPLVSAGDYDAVVAKLDGATGEQIWAKRFGDQRYQDTYDMVVNAAGHVFLTGNFQSTVSFGGPTFTSPSAFDFDLFVVELDADGEHVWSRAMSGVGDSYAHSVALDSQGNVLLTGSFTGTLDLGGGVALVSAGDEDAYVIKLSPAGDLLWSRQYGVAGLERGVSIAADAWDNVLVTGYFQGGFDAGGGLFTSAGSDDMLVVLLDPNGGHVFSARYGDAQYQGGYGIAASPSGDVYVTGRFNGLLDFPGMPITSAGNRDIFVAKMSGAACAVYCASPHAEVCNGLDDDCDGVVDEGLGLGAACTSGVGACAKQGALVCGGGAVVCSAIAGAPQAESCNGLDDDCDGNTDEGFGLGVPCSAGVGACLAQGAIVCDGAGAATCDAVPGAPSEEVCGDGVDDDCDGVADDGCPPPPMCVSDGDCGGATSGLVCDAGGTCIEGCRGQNGNGCPDGETCSSSDASIGTCSPDSGCEGGGCGGGGGATSSASTSSTTSGAGGASTSSTTSGAGGASTSSGAGSTTSGAGGDSSSSGDAGATTGGAGGDEPTAESGCAAAPARGEPAAAWPLAAAVAAALARRRRATRSAPRRGR
jgi:hypothetical protein